VPVEHRSKKQAGVAISCAFERCRITLNRIACASGPGLLAQIYEVPGVHTRSLNPAAGILRTRRVEADDDAPTVCFSKMPEFRDKELAAEYNETHSTTEGKRFKREWSLLSLAKISSHFFRRVFSCYAARPPKNTISEMLAGVAALRAQRESAVSNAAEPVSICSIPQSTC
jgi:hypothetical protein